MKKILLSFLFFSGFVLSSDNIGKTSQLEMFLFKIGFESLLEDVRFIKEKSNINGEDIDNLNKKIDYILNELTKNNKNFELEQPSTQSKEVEKLKNIIARLENKVMDLENTILNSALNTKDKKIKKDYSDTVIVNDEVLNIIEKYKTTKYSIQVGIYKEQHSIDATKKRLEKLITGTKYHTSVNPCTTCRNTYLSKVVIEGFTTKKEAYAFMKKKQLKNSMVVNNFVKKNIK